MCVAVGLMDGCGGGDALVVAVPVADGVPELNQNRHMTSGPKHHSPEPELESESDDPLAEPAAPWACEIQDQVQPGWPLVPPFFHQP